MKTGWGEYVKKSQELRKVKAELAEARTEKAALEEKTLNICNALIAVNVGGGALREIEKAKLAARDELLADIDDLLIGAILGATESAEAWAMIRDMARDYREKIEAALGGKEP